MVKSSKSRLINLMDVILGVSGASYDCKQVMCCSMAYIEYNSL